MKKLILLFLSVFILSSCVTSVAEPVDMSSWQNYQNEYYHFQISYPEGYSHCLNAYCINEIPADALSTFTVLNELGDPVISIQPYKNALGMSAMEYGEKAAAYNENTSDSESITFAGQDAFAFTTDGSFYEPGGASGITEDGHISLTYNASATEVPFVQVAQNSRVIYVDYEGYFYRITYSDNEEAKTIIESFEFTPLK